MHANDHERFTVIAHRNEWLTLDTAHRVPVVVATFTDDHTARAVTAVLNNDQNDEIPVFDVLIDAYASEEPF